MHYKEEEEEDYWRDEEDEDSFWKDDWQCNGIQVESLFQKRSENLMGKKKGKKGKAKKTE